MYSSLTSNTVLVLACSSLASLLVGILLGRRSVAGKAAKQRAGGTSRRRAKAEGSAELYVGNLPYDVDDAQVRKLFSEFGKVLGIRIIENRNSGKSKGYGFVDMADAASATRAVEALHRRKFKGRRLVVNAAKGKARQEKTSSNGR